MFNHPKDEKRPTSPRSPLPGPGPVLGPGPGPASGTIPARPDQALAATLAYIPALTYYGGGSADFHRLRWELGRVEAPVADRVRALTLRLSHLESAKEHEGRSDYFGDGNIVEAIKQAERELADLKQFLRTLQEPISALLDTELALLKPLRIAITDFIKQRMVSDTDWGDHDENGWLYVWAHRFQRATDYMLLRTAGFTQHHAHRQVVHKYEDSFSFEDRNCEVCLPVDTPYQQYLFKRIGTPLLPPKPDWDKPATRRRFANIPLRMSGYGRHVLSNAGWFSHYHRQARESRLVHIDTAMVKVSMEALASIWPLPEWPAFMDAFMLPERGTAQGPRSRDEVPSSSSSSSSFSSSSSAAAGDGPASPRPPSSSATLALPNPLFSLQRRCLIQLELLGFRKFFDRIRKEALARPTTPLVLVNVISAVQHSGTKATINNSLKSTSSMVLDFTRGQEAIFLDDLGMVWPRMKQHPTARLRAATLPDTDHSHMMWLFMLMLTLLGAREIRIFGMHRTDNPCEVDNPHDPLASPWWTEPEAPAGPGPGSRGPGKRKREDGDH